MAEVSGKSLAALAQKLEASVFVTEEKILSPSSRASLKQWGITYEENGHTDKAWETDLVVASSGLSPNSQPVQEARKRKIPVIGELDFVAPFLKGKILAVTGSNGENDDNSSHRTSSLRLWIQGQNRWKYRFSACRCGL